MTWRRPGDKPLSEPMMVCLLTHICVTRPQWVIVESVRRPQMDVFLLYAYSLRWPNSRGVSEIRYSWCKFMINLNVAALTDTRCYASWPTQPLCGLMAMGPMHYSEAKMELFGDWRSFRIYDTSRSMRCIVCHIVPYRTVSYHILSYPILSYPILSYPIITSHKYLAIDFINVVFLRESITNHEQTLKNIRSTAGALEGCLTKTYDVTM